MKHVFLSFQTFVLCLCVLCGCSEEKKIIKQLEPEIEAYMPEKVATPGTYKPLSTRIYGEGKADINTVDFHSFKDYPDFRDVIVLEHTFQFRNRAKELTEGKYYYFFAKELDYLFGVRYFPDQVDELLEK